VIRTRRFVFQRRGPKRLALRFSVSLLGGDWDEVEVRMDAVTVGRATRELLWDGVEYRLFDDSVLRMWLESTPGGPPFLNVTRNGHPLPGSDGDPLYSVRSMVVMLWVFAALQVLAEVVVIIPTDRRNDPGALQTDYWLTATGVIVVLLCILAWRRSVAALVAACALFAGQLVLFFAFHPSYRLLWMGLLPMIGFVWFTLRAVRAAIDLKAMRLPIRPPLRES
jgi:hypothetical protein